MAALPQGTGFTNINRIINENQDNKLGSTVQSGVQQGINSLNNNVQQSQNQFNQGVQANSFNTDTNQQYVSGLLGGITGANTPTPPTQSSIAPSTAQKAPLGAFAPAGAQAAGAEQKATSDDSGIMATPATAGPSALGSPTPSTFTAPSAPDQSTTSTATPAASTSSSSPSKPINSTTDLSNNPGSFGLSQAGSGATQTNMQGQGFTAPTAADISRFGQYLQGGYAGPQQLNNYQQMLGQAQQLQQTGQNVQSQGGLQSLLQRYVGGSGGGYNQGEQKLDTLLLGQTGKPQLQNIMQATQNIGQVPQTAEAQAEAQAATVGTQNNAFKQNVLNQLASGENPILQNIQGNLGTLGGQNSAYQNQAQQVYNLLNNINPTSTTGAAITPAAKQANAVSALTQAQQNGMITTDQLNDITAMLPKIQASGGDLEAALQGMFTYNPQSQLPNYTLQQGASGQQAAQLSALQQLGQDQSGQFNTFGGLALPNYGFDLSKAPSFSSLTPAQQSAATSTAPNRGALYDLTNSTYGAALAPVEANVAALGTSLGDFAQGGQQLASGNLVGAANTEIGAPSDIINSGTHSLEGGVDNAQTSLNHLIGNVPGSNIANNYVDANKQLLYTPINTLNSALSGLTNTGQGLVSDIGSGHLQQALPDLGKNINQAGINALNQLKQGLGNLGTDITGMAGGSNSAVNQAINAITHPTLSIGGHKFF